MVMEEQEPNMELASENIPVPQVQEPKIDMIKRNNKSSVSRGKPRLRKKALHASIVKQMEFYFSDANLSKDRFLAELLKKDSYIDLDVFMKCNKLRELSVDINRIAKALHGSTMLKVSEDGTKVCRVTPINKKEDVDECTIYVQNLPPDTDHDWLISIFSKYGPVEYVSIPRYKSNKKIKGFAFVEFDTPSSAQECIKRFQKKGCVLPSHTSPNDLLSITTFDDPNKDCTLQAIKSTNAKLKSEDDEGEETSRDETVKNDDNRDNKMDTTDSDKQYLKRKKIVTPKSSVIDESDFKVKRRKKSADQSVTEQQDDQTSKNEAEAKSSAINESDIKTKRRKKSISQSVIEQQDDQTLKNEAEAKSLTIDENDIKIKRRKKSMSQNVIEQQNDQTLKDETEAKSSAIDESDIKIKKRKKSASQSVTEQQNDQISKDENEVKDITHNNEINIVESRQKLKRRKFSFEESRIVDENNVNVTENSNIENQENKSVNRNKVLEKKKRRVTISDTVVVENISEEIGKKESHRSATISKKDAGTESGCLNKDNDDNEIEAANNSQTRRKSSTKSSDVEEASIDEKKKKRSRKKKSKFGDDDICNMIGLQIMAKPHWKHLRNRYLDLQKSKMQQLKQHLKKTEIERGGIITKRRWNYDKPKYETDNGETEKASYGRINYMSGIIVKIEMDEPCTDSQSFKIELKDGNNSVKYIDVTPGSCEAFIRCDTAEAAQSFAQKSHEGRRLTILEGDEEKAYWDKIAQDRKEKFSKNKNVKQRGRYKLLKRAEKELGKCIKFDQD